MFIRKKMVRGTAYYSVVESRRVAGKVQQKTIVSLGQSPSIAEALEDMRWWLEQYRHNAAIKPRKAESGRKLFIWDTGGWCVLVIGKAARLRAEKLERQIKLLES